MSVYALFFALCLTGLARKNADSFGADLTGVTDISTLTTMGSARLEVKAASLTGILTAGTGDRAFSIATDFAVFALGPTSSAVGAVVVEVGAIIAFFAIVLAFGTLGFDTLAVVAILVAVAAFERFVPFKATFGIGQAALELTGHFVDARDALELLFLADLRFGTIGNTFVIVTFFPVFADLVILARPPGVVCLTNLCTFATTLAPNGFALAGGVGFAGFAAVGDAGRFVGACAVFVFKTFDTTCTTIAVLTLRAILVRAADTAIVTGALFGGAGLALALLVFQTGNAFTAGRAVFDKTTFRAFFTAGDG